MPQNNPMGYAPPEQQMQMMLSQPAGMGGDMGNMGQAMMQAVGPALPSYMAAPPAMQDMRALSPSQTAIPTEQMIRPQPVQQQAMPQMSDGDMQQIGQMSREQVNQTRQALQQRGWLTQDVDVVFSKRLQQIQSAESQQKRGG